MADEIERELNKLLEIRKQLITLANMQYTPETCPLSKSQLGHHDLSQILFGEGVWCWTCKFCGVEHSDSY